LVKREDIEKRSEELLLPIIEANNFELVDIEYVKEGSSKYLRAYIDKEGGITIDDCVMVSRAFNEILDAEDYIDESYILEVSSPGLGRPLKKDKDFNRNIGKDVEVRLYRALNRKKEYEGTLKAYDSETLTLVMEDDSELCLERSNIALVRLALDF
jgi:ribosome maturation factor RimP